MRSPSAARGCGAEAAVTPACGRDVGSVASGAVTAGSQRSGLPEERVPFPVEPRYRVRPDLRRWTPDDRGYLRLDRRYPEYVAEKLRLLSEDPAGCRVLAPGVEREALVRTLLRIASELARETADEPAGGAGSGHEAAGPSGPERALRASGLVTPAWKRPTRYPPAVLETPEALRFPRLGLSVRRAPFRVELEDPVLTAGRRLAAGGHGGGVLPRGSLERVHAHLATLAPLEQLADALALSVQEDLVVLAGEAAPDAPGAPPDGRAELLHVCFPSGWDPAARAGAGFAALHAPVPHKDVLVAAAGRVVRAMTTRGPFVRYVWSLSPDGRLDRNPRRAARAGRPARASELWFRVERQSVLPLPELGRALFTIRVYRAPLASVAATDERRRTLAAALASMDEALLAYKGVGGIRDEVLAWLGAPPGGQGAAIRGY